MSLYDELEVAPDAAPADIKRSYRKLAQQHHPDKGGDKERFQAVQHAYDVLSDEERRAQYDSTGDDGAPQDIRHQGRAALAALTLQLVDFANPATTDLIAAACKNVRERMEQIKRTKEDLQRSIERRESALARMTFSGQGADIVANAIRLDIQQKRVGLLQHDREIALGEEMLLVLKDYTYRADATAKVQRQHYNSHGETGGLSEMFGGMFR